MAAPNPEKEISRLASLLRADPAPSVFVFQGQQRWFRDRALDLVKDKLGAQGDVFEHDASSGEGSANDAAGFLMDLRTRSLFGGQKVLMLRSAERWLKSHGKLLAEVLDGLAPGNALVIEVAKLDGRSALAKKLKKLGAVFDFRNLYDKPFGDRGPATSAELVQWVCARAKSKKLRLSPASALFMTQVVGNDPGQLEGEMDLLASQFAGKEITPETMREVLTVSFGSSQFEFVDALLEKDAQKALRSVHAMFREGLRDRDGKRMDKGAIFPMAMAWLVQSIATLIEGRHAIDQGESGHSVVQRMGGYFKDRFERQLRGLDTPALANIHAAAMRAERRLRSSGEEPDILLERLVCETCLKHRCTLLGAEDKAW